MASEQPERPDGVRITDRERSTVDGGTLTAQIGLDADEIAWRKAFTGFDDADADRLVALEGTVGPRTEMIVDEFYDHLEGFDETVEIFGRSSKSVGQLKETQAQYLRDLLTGEYDRQYFENRARIGKIHDMLDLGPKIYLGAYSLYFEHFLRAIVDDVTERESSLDAALESVFESALSVFKLINLDQQVAMDTYIASYNDRLQSAIEKQERLMAQVDEDLQGPIDELSQSQQAVAETTQQLTVTADQQASSTEEVADEVADMSATIEEIASTAEEVAATSESAQEMAERGQSAAADAVNVMDDVDDAVSTASTDIGALQEQAGEIDEIVDVINGIADQTNILALNASIEAARAGEAGDGFAVVADEIKTLAGQSQDHANRIEAMVEEIQSETGTTVESLESVTEQVADGIEQVNTAMDGLEEITTAIEETARGIQEVSEATDDQAASTEEVASMVDELAEGVADMADKVQDVAAANEEQTAKVEEIASTTAQLTGDGDAHGTPDETDADGPRNLRPDDF